MNKQTGHTSRRRWLRAAIAFVGLGLATAVGIVAAVTGAYYYVEPGLPKPETIRDIPLQIPLRIYSRDGYLIEEIGQRRREVIRYEDVPEHVVEAFIAAEDRRFFEHPGIDYIGILRALSQLVTTGDVQAGGSTLTQQLARDYFLTRERLMTRKIREAFLAYKIEQEFTKEQIMALFLNKMFFGQRAYGVAAASQVYFNKPLADINVAEAATLAGVLPAPSLYNPVRSPANAERRRAYVLGRMRDLDYISGSEYAEAMAWPMESRVYGAAVELNAPYVAEMVRREMLARYGEDTYTAGYRVVTSLDSKLQRAANYALRNGLLAFTRRRGYRGPVTHFDLEPDTLAVPVLEWPEPIRQALDQYAPGGLRLAIATAINDNNSVSIRFADGTGDAIPWAGLSWAKPFIDVQTTGPAPESAADVLAVGDVVYVMPTRAGFWALAQVPEAQSAIVSMDPVDGAITSLIGGFDFAMSKFNRATQSARQPGSSFKPFIYSAALEYGNTPATVVLDAPVVINSSELEAVWRPINYSGRFYGPTRLREALVRSMNLVSVRLLLFETGVGNAVRHIARFGFGEAALPRNGSLALGAGAASPLDMAQGYATIANGGFAIKPYVIDAIYGPEDDMIYRAEPRVACAACERAREALEQRRREARPAARPEDEPGAVDDAADAGTAAGDDTATLLDSVADVALDYRPDPAEAPELFEDVNVAPRAISAQNAYLVTDMMRDVIRRGTGRRALTLGRRDLSGKTGTSNDRRDAWFGGFNADLASIVWVGYDDDSPLGPGEEGSRTALPIWIDFSRRAYEGAPEHTLPMPEGIVSVRIDRETGCPARAGQTNAIFEVFEAGKVPECETREELPDVFNDTGGVGDLFGTPGEAVDAEADEDQEEEPAEEDIF